MVGNINVYLLVHEHASSQCKEWTFATETGGKGSIVFEYTVYYELDF